MVPRLLIDASWRDLLSYFSSTLFDQGGARDDLRAALESRTDRSAVPGLSVRTLFDALLTVCAFDDGDEVLMSAVTIENMAEIVRSHGLVPVPVDLDTDSLAPGLAALAKALSPRTRMLVIAPLFGGKIDLADISDFCQSKDVPVVEDMAQAFDGAYYGSHHADFSMMSFGPIKRRTALAGGALLCRHAQPAAAIDARLTEHPLLSNNWYRKRIIKLAAIKAISQQSIYGMLLSAIRVLGKDSDKVIGRAARGFQGDVIEAIRKQPPDAVYAAIFRQVARRRDGLEESARAELLSQVLPDTVQCPGHRTRGTGTWIYPISVKHREDLMYKLRTAGIDATSGATSMRALAPAGSGNNNSAQELMASVVYLPIHAGISQPQIKRMAKIVSHHVASEHP